ncbi:hypothetical protein AC1031_004434 [Aphanomyces cochlioides]|nr:hypothetical protein AC1031_004434 [Aphanomyces cochlioides]
MKRGGYSIAPGRNNISQNNLVKMILAFLVGLATTAVATVHVDIAGGEAVPLSMFPDYIALLVDDPRNVNKSCTGSLIAPSFVLTSGFCVQHISWAYLGANDVSGKDAKEQFQLLRGFIHPTNISGTRVYDFRLLQLSGASKLTHATISWDDDQFNAPGVSAWIRGYGRNSTYGRLPKTLRQAQVTILPMEKCWHVYGQGVDPVRMMCAGDQRNNPCIGDVGAPLTAIKDGKEQVVGITSWVWEACGSFFPRIFGRLSAAKTFVDSVLSPPTNECFERPMLK